MCEGLDSLVGVEGQPVAVNEIPDRTEGDLRVIADPLIGKEDVSEEDDEGDDPSTTGTRFQTAAPTQRVRSWLSAAKRFVSETTALVRLLGESEPSDDERQVVEDGAASVGGALNDLEVALNTAAVVED